MDAKFNHQVYTRCGWVCRPVEELQPGDVLRMIAANGRPLSPEQHWQVTGAPEYSERLKCWLMTAERIPCLQAA